MECLSFFNSWEGRYDREATGSGLHPRFCDETYGTELGADLEMNNRALFRTWLAFAVNR